MSEIIQPRDLSYVHLSYVLYTLTVEEIFEVVDEPPVTSIRHILQNLRGMQEKLHANYDPF